VNDCAYLVSEEMSQAQEKLRCSKPYEIVQILALHSLGGRGTGSLKAGDDALDEEGAVMMATVQDLFTFSDFSQCSDGSKYCPRLGMGLPAELSDGKAGFHGVGSRNLYMSSGPPRDVPLFLVDGKCYVYSVDDIEGVNAAAKGSCKGGGGKKDAAVNKSGTEGVISNLDVYCTLPDHFYVTHSVNPKTNKARAIESVLFNTPPPSNTKDSESVKMRPLRGMELFAGCGGMSVGFEASGTVDMKYAVEKYAEAGKSFLHNHPGCDVYMGDQEGDVNVLLKRMLAGNFTTKDGRKLPQPGDVDFIFGGPPCQGYSTMNRFQSIDNHNCTLVTTMLSWCDFFRPRFFMLENVRGILSWGMDKANIPKGVTVKLIVRTLVQMGYQVRWAILQAGMYGCPQSRRRVIIWGARCGERLPEFPEPTHCFRKCEMLSVRLGGRDNVVSYPYKRMSAPLEGTTVHDAISDLPPIGIGHSIDETAHILPPQSEYQRFLRRNLMPASTQQMVSSEEEQAAIEGRAASGLGPLYNHITKQLNGITAERIRRVPTREQESGTGPRNPKHWLGKLNADSRIAGRWDWRDIPDEKFGGEALIPWCLPNTAERHNDWKGLFGRLDWNSYFETMVTDPQPMGKTGRVLHPVQHRITSVRENARAQGFPDHFRFKGALKDKYRQIGNAVPPPLAHALGSKLKFAMLQTEEEGGGMMM
jgi:DNA (cytosine-5)-methyltransferase 1